MQQVPAIRLRSLNAAPVNPDGDFVLYWMTAFRRPFFNFALQWAVQRAVELRKPLLILEALRCDYPFASDRLHRFVLDGMAANERHFAGRPCLYYPYVEDHRGEGAGLLAALAGSACLVVADDSPAFFLPRMLLSAAGRVEVALEAVDGNGILPLRAADHDYPTAYAFRRFLQKVLRGHLLDAPLADPLSAVKLPGLEALPSEIAGRWPRAGRELLQGTAAALAALPIDHRVPVVETRGGFTAAGEALELFVEERLPLYAERRSEPEQRVTSELSPYLHFGHIGSHQVLGQVCEKEGWDIGRLSPESRGKRSGWWGLSPSAEAFADQLVTWRELGFNMCAFRSDCDRYSSLPDWARQTLGQHRDDFRPYRYALADFEQGRTHDPLWNAAQAQLVREGRMHNYLRMLWGKKILEWSESPEAALRIMLELNDRYALDGRDPNSLSGIFWCLGRYDRAWGPQRPIFGKIRYMSSENTARKFSLKGFLADYGPAG
ncbi:deoxyribodipyrimidine photolyase [Trichloromonas sp.]|uniref:deoxyribodipyrimidine photolyase n=1 Tax=Trichloromonas sp. TaxID=3069249 RepID=UPI003D813934